MTDYVNKLAKGYSMKERILKAYEIADKAAFEYSGGNTTVPEEEQAILNKWLDQGLISYVNQKKGKMSRQLYFPVLESSEWDGLSGKLWLKIMWYVMNKYGIESGLSSNSVSEYVSRAYKYNISHGVITANYAGVKQVKEEESLWDELKAELKEAEDGK